MRSLLTLCCLLFLASPVLAEGERPAAREFMLSFDDGPLPGRTDKVLQALQRISNGQGRPLRVAFFMLSDPHPGYFSGLGYFAPYDIWSGVKGSMRKHPELVTAVRNAGHLIGNHTAHHSWFRWPWRNQEQSIRREIQGWESVAQQHPAQPRLFRPPYLVNSAAVQAIAERAGYQIVLGQTVGDTDPTNTPDQIKQNILAILERQPVDAGPVVLIFHDTMTLTSEHLSEIITFVQQQGHRPVDFDPARLPGARTQLAEPTVPPTPVASHAMQPDMAGVN